MCNVNNTFEYVLQIEVPLYSELIKRVDHKGTFTYHSKIDLGAEFWNTRFWFKVKEVKMNWVDNYVNLYLEGSFGHFKKKLEGGVFM